MTQTPVKQISDLAEFVRDTIGATLVQGPNVTIAVNDAGDAIEIGTTSSGGSLLSVDTYAAARALTAGQLTGQTLVHVRGRSAANDGAGGIFAVVSGAGTDDGGVVLSVASNTMRLVRQYEGIASAAWWGVLPSSSDVGPALQAAQDWADGFSQKRGIFIPEGFYYIRTPVILKVPTEGVRPEGSSDGNHGTVFQWVSPTTWPSTVGGRLCDLFEPVFATTQNNATRIKNISVYGDYGGGGSNKDTYLDGAMFPSLKFFKIPTNGMTGLELVGGVEVENCKFQGFLIGIQNRDASHTRLINCTLDANYVGMWYWSNRGDHAIKDTGLTSHIAGTVAGGEGWTVQMDGNHLGFGTYGLLQIGTPRYDPLRDTRSQWRHWYNNSYTVKKASRFNVSTLSGAYGEYQLGDTVGLFNQDTPSQNGIWIVNSGAWTRDPSFTAVVDAVVVVRFSANVNIRETVWRVTAITPNITFQENPIGGVWECLWRNTRHEACGEAAIYTFANSTTGNCKFEFTGAGFDGQVSAQIFNLSPAMIASMGGQTQEYLFRFGVIGSTFIFEQDNFTNSGISPQAGAARLGNYIHQLDLPANVDLDLRGLGKVTFGTLTTQRSPGALLTQVRQSGDNAATLAPYQDMPPVYNPGKLQPGGLYDLLNPAAWNAGGDTVRTLVDAASVDPYPVDMAISLPPNSKAIYFDKTTNPWAWGWRQTATFPAMGQRFGYFWAWVKGRVSLKIRPRNGSGQIAEYRGDTRSEISGWQPLQLGNMDFSGATHIEFRIDSENSSSFWIAGAVFSWDDYAPYSETTRPATRDGFQFLNGDFASTIDTATLTGNQTILYPNGSGTLALSSSAQPIDADLTAMANLSTTGLVERTGAGTAATQAISTTGRALVNAANQAAARTAIDAVNPLYVQSRLQGLVTNGFGLLQTNQNFPGLTFDAVDTAPGTGGSFRHVGLNLTYFSSELIPVDVNKFYEFSLQAKAGNIDGSGFNSNNRQFTGLVCVDIDGNNILPEHFAVFQGSSLTTLAAPLNPGDTTITLTSAAGWANGSNLFDRHIRWYGYTNTFGYRYPNYTYSRNQSASLPGNAASGTWLQGGISGNVITLRVPWAGPAIPSGTAVSNAIQGSFYKYLALNNTIVPQTWTAYRGVIGGVDTARNNTLAFPPGCAFVRILILPNLIGAGSTDAIRFAAIGFSQNIAESFPAGTFPAAMGFASSIAVGSSGAGRITGTDAVNTTLSNPGAGWSFTWARAQVGDMIQIIPRDGSSNAITGRCAVAGTVLADTSAWSAGLSIQLRILRTAP